MTVRNIAYRKYFEIAKEFLSDFLFILPHDIVRLTLFLKTLKTQHIQTYSVKWKPKSPPITSLRVLHFLQYYFIEKIRFYFVLNGSQKNIGFI